MNLFRRGLLATPAILLAGPARAAEDALRVVSPWEFDDPDPIQTGYILRRIGVAETLVGVQPDGSLTGLLAESWAVDPDRLTWRFRLRDARFHDGAPVTAAHVVWTLQRVREQAESLSAIPIDSIVADGDRGVVIRTRTPFAPLPGYLTDYAGAVLAPSAYDAAGKPQRPIGTGPYRVTDIGGARSIAATVFPGYWGAQPAISKIAYNAVVLGDTRASMAEAGDVDVAFTLLPEAARRIEAAGRGRILRLTTARARMIIMNLALPQFSDLRVRRAMSLALDRDGIAAAILRDPASSASQLLPPGLEDWHDPALPSLHRDVAEARRLLADAGWAAAADGVLQKSGVRLAASMLVPANRPELPLMAQAVQAQLRAVGIAIEVRPGPPGAAPGAIRDGSLQTALLSRTYVNVPDPVGTMLPDFTGTHQVWASPGFANADMERAVQAYIQGFDEQRLSGLRKRMVAILQDQLPVIPVAWSELNMFVSPRVAPASAVLDPYEQSYRLPAMRWA